MENLQPNESWIKSTLFYIPRLIASLFSALAMDEKGLSLKKILALMGTIEGIRVTELHCCKENAICYLIIWLIWVGILVGIYSLKDISGAFNTFKGNKDETKI